MPLRCLDIVIREAPPETRFPATATASQASTEAAMSGMDRASLALGPGTSQKSLAIDARPTANAVNTAQMRACQETGEERQDG